MSIDVSDNGRGYYRRSKGGKRKRKGKKKRKRKRERERERERNKSTDYATLIESMRVFYDHGNVP